MTTSMPLGGMVETSQPSCQAVTSDVSALIQGSSITIGDEAYSVKEVHPDGTGLTTLVLELAA